VSDNQYLTLPGQENQARGLGEYAVAFLDPGSPDPDESVFASVERFHRDTIACAVSAIALRANAPTVLRDDALTRACSADRSGVPCFGSAVRVSPEKAVAANCSAVREWDANGTNFGYNPHTGRVEGEFGHNDFYPVAVAAAQQAGLDGRGTLKAMVCLDEIRGRLAESFALRKHKIDHVLHGAIASAAVYGAVLGATAQQIEFAIGMVAAHYVPFRAVRAGDQLSDSKGASAALSAEVAVTSMERAMRGFVGPRDIFRNPKSLFCLDEKPDQPPSSPFDLTVATAGDDFAIQGMHFKIGLYEHQSAGAIQGLIDVLSANPDVLKDADRLRRVRITIYEPAFSIIGDPAKRDPRTRQSADHSMVYIIATLLRKAYNSRSSDWRQLMLMPEDYDSQSLVNTLTRQLMEKIDFVHGGAEYDRRYPDGIPTTLELEHAQLGKISSGLVMYPTGHARSENSDLDDLLSHKFYLLARRGVRDVDALEARFSGLVATSPEQIKQLYDFEIENR